MASAATTPNLGLPQWTAAEKPERTDLNAAFLAIDALNPIYGIWTPTFAGTSVPGVNAYSLQSGIYIKIGKLVHVEFKLIMTAKQGAMAGGVTIAGLPFSTALGAAGANISIAYGITMPALYQNQLVASVSGTSIAFVGFSNGSFDAVLCDNLAEDAYVFGSADYMTN